MPRNVKNKTFPEPQVVHGSLEKKNSIEIQASCRTDSSSPSTGRRNRSSTVSRTDKYANIEGGIIPFLYGAGNGKYSSNISIKDAIILCQKAYYNFSIFRNTIDLMTEFSCSPVYFTGGNEQSRKFFKAWGDRINIWRLQDMFFREFFRSGNVFVYKLNAEFSKQDMRVLSDLITTEARSGEVPIRYIILNPADIQAIGSASFIAPRYIKILNDFEMQVLSNPTTEQDRQLAQRVKSLKDISSDSKIVGGNQYMVFELDPDKFVSIFYKKQDYEPFSVPMGFPVLEDINWKAELKNMDMAISRTIQQAVLLVTMGNDEVGMPTKDQIANLRKIFENESVGRVLVTDYTTDVEFKIPAIGDILDPRKYEVVDRDIRYGLNNVLFGEEKYANTSTKIEVFLSRLKHARETFMVEFLLPEMKKICKDLGFKNMPIPRFKDADFKNDINISRIYSRLIELGVLTPEEGLTAIETGRLPLPEESVESQKRFTSLQEQGLYQPLLNKPQDQGRPTGTSGVSKTVNTPKNISKGSASLDPALIKKNLMMLDNLKAKVETSLKEKFKKRALTAQQKEVVELVTEIIISNESPSDWLEKVNEYLSNTVNETRSSRNRDIEEISSNFGLSYSDAAIIYHSRA